MKLLAKPAAKKRQVDTQRWHSPVQPSLGFARIGYEDFHFEPHFHEHYVIMLVEKGVNLGQRCREKYAVSEGEMLLIQPGEMHTGNSLNQDRLQYLAFYPSQDEVGQWLEKMEHRSGNIPDFGLKYKDLRLAQAFRHLFTVVSENGAAPLESDIAAIDFFETLAAAQPGHASKISEASLDSQKFKKAVAFICDRFADNFSLDALAAAADCSPFHLIRLFRRHSGMTPFDYLRSVRIEHAKRFMRSSQNLTEVAYRTGFYDQSHFIRSFKKHTGFLPSDFRKL